MLHATPLPRPTQRPFGFPRRGSRTPAHGWAPRRHRAGFAAVALGHALLALLLWQAAPRLEHLVVAPPVLRVALLGAPFAVTAPLPTTPVPRVPTAWSAPPLPVPALEVEAARTDRTAAAPAPLPVPAPVAAAAPEPAPRTLAPPAAVPAPPPPPPPPTAPRELPASSIAYLVPPPVELPLASRRLGEQGTVWLRVRVGADGLPRQVTLHKSSGHARLDEQALGAMRQARFKPQVENGVPVEWIVIAPLQYEIS